MIKRMLLKYAAWLIRNASARLYTSPVPVGSRIGGGDIPQLPDKYLILDVRFKALFKTHILILGWFQVS